MVMKKLFNPDFLVKNCRERVSQLETIIDITALLNTELDLSHLLDKIMKTAKKVMKAEIAALALLDEERKDLVFQFAVSGKGNLIKSLGGLQRLKVGSGINGTVVKTGKALIVQDCREHPTFNIEYEKRTGIAFGPMLCVPIRAKDKIIGSCSVIRKRNAGKPFLTKDLHLFKMFCDSAAMAIQNAKVHQVLMQNQRLETDIEFSRSVQESFLPVTFPKHKNYTFAGKTLPTHAVGGDFFDFISFDKNNLGILLGDVSGKGFPAALHMARLMSDFRSVARMTREPAEIFYHINNILFDRSRRKITFATAVILLLDMKHNVVRAANAGHPPLLVANKNRRLSQRAKPSGPPLGIVHKARYETDEFSLNSGDLVFLFSDGLTEARNGRKKFFGLRRIREFLKRQNNTPRTLIKKLHENLKDFAQNTPQSDDVTVVAVTKK